MTQTEVFLAIAAFLAGAAIGPYVFRRVPRYVVGIWYALAIGAGSLLPYIVAALIGTLALGFALGRVL